MQLALAQGFHQEHFRHTACLNTFLCGRDGFLTAWLPDSRPQEAGTQAFDEPDDRFWQIPAKRRYYFPAQDGGK